MTSSEAGRELVRKRWDNATPEDKARQGQVMRAGRRPRLTMDQAREIRRRVAAGEPRKKMVREYGVCLATIGSIVRGHNYPEK